MKKSLLGLVLNFILVFSVALASETNRKFVADEEAIYQLLAISNARDAQHGFIQEALEQGSEAVKSAALNTIAHIASPASLPLVKPFLDNESEVLRRWAAFALGQIGGDDALTIVKASLQTETSKLVKAELLKSLGLIGNETTLAIFSESILSARDPLILEGASQGLGFLLTFKLKEIDLNAAVIERLFALSLKSAPVGETAAFALSRIKPLTTPFSVRKISATIDKSTSTAVKALLCRMLAKTRSFEASQALLAILQNESGVGVRIEAIRALAIQIPTNDVLAALARQIKDSKNRVVVSALNVLQGYGAAASSEAPIIAHIYSSHKALWAKSEALKALAAVDKAIARQFVHSALDAKNPMVLKAAIFSLSILGESEELAALAIRLRSDNLVQAEAASEALLNLGPNQVNQEIVASALLALAKPDLALSANLAEFVKVNKIAAAAPILASIYPAFNRADDVEVKVAILGALAAIGTHQQLSTIDAALNDPVKQVVEVAAEAHKAISGEDVSAKIPLNTSSSKPMPSPEEIKRAIKAKVSIRTSKGLIVLQMLASAPLNATNFVSLVESGFYDNLTFHRVVPNFVAQGGDPRGDGYGGPGFLIRDEYSFQRHERGAIGMASAGKDTAGSQLFIDLAPNLHLNSHYTLFAEVISGIAVADKLEAGDKILNAWVTSVGP